MEIQSKQHLGHFGRHFPCWIPHALRRKAHEFQVLVISAIGDTETVPKGSEWSCTDVASFSIDVLLDILFDCSFDFRHLFLFLRHAFLLLLFTYYRHVHFSVMFPFFNGESEWSCRNVAPFFTSARTGWFVDSDSQSLTWDADYIVGSPLLCHSSACGGEWMIGRPTIYPLSTSLFRKHKEAE